MKITKKTTTSVVMMLKSRITTSIQKPEVGQDWLKRNREQIRDKLKKGKLKSIYFDLQAVILTRTLKTAWNRVSTQKYMVKS